MQVEIVVVAAEEIWAIRHRSLRRGQAVGTERMPGIDEHPQSIHLLLKVDGEGVGCATFMPEPNGVSEWRLRGMAIDELQRRKGLGKQLIDYAINDTAVGGSGIWCNARTSALKFYAACSFVAEGDEFDISPIGPHYVMRTSTQH